MSGGSPWLFRGVCCLLEGRPPLLRPLLPLSNCWSPTSCLNRLPRRGGDCSGMGRQGARTRTCWAAPSKWGPERTERLWLPLPFPSPAELSFSRNTARTAPRVAGRQPPPSELGQLEGPQTLPVRSHRGSGPLGATSPSQVPVALGSGPRNPSHSLVTLLRSSQTFCFVTVTH